MRGRAAKRGMILGTTIVLLLIMVSLSVLVVSLASVSARSVTRTINDLEKSMAFSCVCERLISLVNTETMPEQNEIVEVMAAYVKEIDEDYVFELNYAHLDYNGKDVFNITIFSDESKSMVIFASTVERYINTEKVLVCRISSRTNTSFDVALSDELMNLISEKFRRDLYGAEHRCRSYYYTYFSNLEKDGEQTATENAKTSANDLDMDMKLSLSKEGYHYTDGKDALSTQFFYNDTNAPAFNTRIEINPSDNPNEPKSENFFVLSVYFNTSDKLAMRITYSLDSMTKGDTLDQYKVTGHYTEIRVIGGESVIVPESTATSSEETTETTETTVADETAEPVE